MAGRFEQDHIWIEFLGQFDTFRTVVGRNCLKAVGFEQHAYQIGYSDIVVNYEHFVCHNDSLSPHYRLFLNVSSLQKVYRLVIFVI